MLTFDSPSTCHFLRGEKRVGNGEIDVSPIPFVVSSLECQKGALYVLGIPINKVIREDEPVRGSFGRPDWIMTWKDAVVSSWIRAHRAQSYDQWASACKHYLAFPILLELTGHDSNRFSYHCCYMCLNQWRINRSARFQHGRWDGKCEIASQSRGHKKEFTDS